MLIYPCRRIHRGRGRVLVVGQFSCDRL